MSLARILSRAQLGLEAPLVQVEVNLSGGLPSFTIVGLPAPVVRESRERVRAALQNSGYEFPARRITVNLAPVELSKQGGSFDLPIALGLLRASGQLGPGARKPFECYGELGLSGELKAVRGVFLAAVQARQAGHALIVPTPNAEEVALSGHAEAFAVGELGAAARRLTGAEQRAGEPIAPLDLGALRDEVSAADFGLEQVIGQWQAKRALLVAAAGGHSVLLVGSPGSGKSMLAARLPSLLPPLTSAEAQQRAAIAAPSHGLGERDGRGRPAPAAGGDQPGPWRGVVSR
jgi:magnesium chelatase family protein